jgi:non-specific serine/threonine protein kinase
VLATSREPLRIRAEWIYRLEPLAVPEKLRTDRRMRDIASVRLFLQVSQAWGGREVGADDDLADIALLCRKLEGIPLAIELAAARTWELSPAAMLAAIGERFIVLRDGPRDLPARHRALEATIGWSYGLLTAEEQHLFRGLAVFAGGVETDALLAVFGEGALPLAERLAEKSLAKWTWRSGSRRLDMLETTRAYAMNALEAAGEASVVQLAHATFFANLAVRSGLDDAKRGAAQIAWTRRLERDQENIHQALANCFLLGESDTALIITSVMGSYWNTHLPSDLARTWIEQALALEPEACHLSAGWSAVWGAAFAWRTLDQDAAIAFEERARQIWTRLDFPRGLAWVEYHRAERLGFAGRYDEMRAIHEVNLGIFQRERDVEGIVHALVGLSISLGMTGQPERGCLALERALDVARDADDLLLHSLILSRLATALLNVGEVERAEAIAVETERLAYLIGDLQSLTFAATVRAWLAFDRNDLPEAFVRAQMALRPTRDLGASQVAWVPLMIWTLAATALGQFDDARIGARELIRSVMAYGGDPCRATVLPELASCILAFGYPAEALTAYAAGLERERAWVAPLPPSCEQRYRADIRTAQGQLEPHIAIRSWNRGLMMEPMEALEVVRQVVVPPNGEVR